MPYDRPGRLSGRSHLGGTLPFWSCPKDGSKVINVSDPQQMKITRRAYELWQQAGEPKDRDEEFYLQAERELKVASENAVATPIRRSPSHRPL